MACGRTVAERAGSADVDPLLDLRGEGLRGVVGGGRKVMGQEGPRRGRATLRSRIMGETVIERAAVLSRFSARPDRGARVEGTASSASSAYRIAGVNTYLASDLVHGDASRRGGDQALERRGVVRGHDQLHRAGVTDGPGGSGFRGGRGLRGLGRHSLGGRGLGRGGRGLSGRLAAGSLLGLGVFAAHRTGAVKEWGKHADLRS